MVDCELRIPAFVTKWMDTFRDLGEHSGLGLTWAVVGRTNDRSVDPSNLTDPRERVSLVVVSLSSLGRRAYQRMPCVPFYLRSTRALCRFIRLSEECLVVTPSRSSLPLTFDRRSSSSTDLAARSRNFENRPPTYPPKSPRIHFQTHLFTPPPPSHAAHIIIPRRPRSSVHNSIKPPRPWRKGCRGRPSCRTDSF